jgi:hypothetical protein
VCRRDVVGKSLPSRDTSLEQLETERGVKVHAGLFVSHRFEDNIADEGLGGTPIPTITISSAHCDNRCHGQQLRVVYLVKRQCISDDDVYEGCTVRD